MIKVSAFLGTISISLILLKELLLESVASTVKGNDLEFIDLINGNTPLEVGFSQLYLY